MADNLGAVRVTGLRELTRAFRGISREANKRLRLELIRAAEPVKTQAQNLALTQIHNMPRSPHWADMRIGVSAAKGLVYMVPQARSRGAKGGSRPNLKGLLLERSMDPALESQQAVIVYKVGQMFDNLADDYGF